MTPAQIQALAALEAHGGAGVIDKMGALVAAGVRLKFDAVTWLRLSTTDHIEPDGPGRLRLSRSGREAVAEHRKGAARLHPRHVIDGSRHKSALIDEDAK